MRKEPIMKKDIRFVGLDVHAETIAVAVAEPDAQVRSLGPRAFPSREELQLVRSRSFCALRCFREPDPARSRPTPWKSSGDSGRPIHPGESWLL